VDSNNRGQVFALLSARKPDAKGTSLERERSEALDAARPLPPDEDVVIGGSRTGRTISPSLPSSTHEFCVTRAG
jgi:hypothetical protein